MKDGDLVFHSNDGFCKEVFSIPENARALFQNHLPPGIVAGIDWSSLTLAPGSFVKKSLRQTHSDLLFSVQCAGRPLLLYLLFEHQTTVDEAMPLRLLVTVAEILLSHHKKHGLPLAPVIPFVLHQGPERWSVSTQFSDLLELPPGAGPELLAFQPVFRYALLDLTQFDPDREERDAHNRVVLQLMKLARENRIREFFRWLAGNFAAAVLTDELLRLSLLYALHTDTSLDFDQIIHSLETNTELKKKAMSTAEHLMEQGRAKGRAEGEARGEARGESRGLWIGKVQVLEELMGLAVTQIEAFAGQDAEKIERRFDKLQARYAKQFKKR